MFTALVIIILLAVIWVLLKLLGFAIKLPFKILDFIFSKSFSTVFWLIVIAYIVFYLFAH